MKTSIKKGYALIIANANYKYNPSVQSCAKDGKDMAKILTSLGFDVMELYDANRDETIAHISDFISHSNSYSTLLLYYSGHGIQMDGKNYFVPVDCKYMDDKSVFIDTQLVDMDIVTNSMDSNQKTNIIILDACRTPLSFVGGLTQEGLAEFDIKNDVFIAFSTSPNKAAIGSSLATENSIYTRYLIQHIYEPNIKIEDVFKKVRSDVDKHTGGLQIPWESTSLKKDFFFNCMSKDEFNEKIYQIIRIDHSANTLCLLSDILQKSISDICRTYWRQKAEKPGGIHIHSEEEFEKFILEHILDLGFSYVNYRWVYNDKAVQMGEFFHNYKDFSR